MSFGYRELTTQIFLNGGDKSPCGNDTKKDDDENGCAICGTTGTPCQTNTCDVDRPDPDKGGGREDWKTLALLRQQLRDSLAAG